MLRSNEIILAFQGSKQNRPKIFHLSVRYSERRIHSADCNYRMERCRWCR